ncbi:ArsR/SmtB family transcription factor [Devosia naphthalenivorans]|uniref:ArsR/SmtB family transcription factor n=1 Tax=Devosia naphthalenivorans TaxID=2082392 RepID=UPI000D34570F|nr:metalloregulator ArsR/SmtB family transcription factor [Devosia naphthalenivorans]
MESIRAIVALSALGQETRLEIFRLLVRNTPEGLPAGEIARRLEVPQNTMSSHLGLLTRAGLLTSERFSRSIVYKVDLDAFRELMLFMVKDCCNGNATLCAPLIAELTPCCQPQEVIQ